MVVLHPISEFISQHDTIGNSSATYWYEGYHPHSGELLRLPRTPLAEEIARGLMQYLANDKRHSLEGKMYGVLLVETPKGENWVLKAFSGLLNGYSEIEGWVPPIPGRERVAIEESKTLAILEAIKQELLALQQIPERQEYEMRSHQFDILLQNLSLAHQARKQERQQQRQRLLETLTGEELATALKQLDNQSCRDGIELRELKRQRNTVLQPLKQVVEQANARIIELKRQRKELSRQLQEQMYASYCLTNFAGESVPLQELMPSGLLPTGTGDCCAPKLLHYAATHGLKPLAMAEFWWGSSSANGDKVQGEFYGACVERCQPLMGFLLSGLPQSVGGNEETRGRGDTRMRGGKAEEAEGRTQLIFTLHPTPEIRHPTPYNRYEPPVILYEDKWLIVVNKPAGLLSVPGRTSDRFDSVLARLRYLLPDGMSLMAVHRLDRDTSGILLLARDLQTYRQLSQQFQQRQVHKVYEAILAGCVTTEQGVIELPLWGNPEKRPYQEVNQERGKPSVTKFRVMQQEGDYTRIEFFPLTGRTHQLRVHAADSRGLGVPILGDRLYGYPFNVSRLHLHARELRFQHPQSGEDIHIQTETPF